MTVSAILVKSLIHEISKYGISEDDILRKYKLNKQLLIDPDERISIEKYSEIETEACELTKNPHFFLEFGKTCIQLSPLIRYIIATETTYKGMLSQFIRYSKLLNEAFVFELTELENVTELKFKIKAANSSYRYTTEMVMANIYWGFKKTWPDFYADKIHFSFQQPACADIYTQLFSCTLVFSSPENSIVFSNTFMDRQVTFEHEYLKPLILEHANKLLSKLSSSSFTKKVQFIVIENLATGKVDANFVANNLNTSIPTLYRQLKKEGTSFHEILQQCKIELAKKYFSIDKLPVIEVAFLLGFSESSPFIRAFKKWTGHTPKEYLK